MNAEPAMTAGEREAANLVVESAGGGVVGAAVADLVDAAPLVVRRFRRK